MIVMVMSKNRWFCESLKLDVYIRPFTISRLDYVDYCGLSVREKNNSCSFEGAL